MTPGWGWLAGGEDLHYLKVMHLGRADSYLLTWKSPDEPAAHTQRCFKRPINVLEQPGTSTA